MPLLHSSPSPSCKNFDATSFTLASDFPGVLDVSLCCLTEGLGLGDQGRTPQRKQDLRNTSPVSKSPRKEEERACRLQRERRGLLAPLSLVRATEKDVGLSSRWVLCLLCRTFSVAWLGLLRYGHCMRIVRCFLLDCGRLLEGRSMIHV